MEFGGRSRSPSNPALLTTQRSPSLEHARNAADARRSAITRAGRSRRSACFSWCVIFFGHGHARLIQHHVEHHSGCRTTPYVKRTYVQLSEITFICT